MNRESTQKLNEYKDKRKKVSIEVCNDYGQIGHIVGYFNNKVKYDIVNDFLFDAIYDGKKELLDIALENYKVSSQNRFYALKIRDSKTNKLLYSNSFKKVFLLSNLNNFYLTDSQLKKWKQDKSVKALLKKVGQYVKIDADGYSTEGVLQAVYLSKKTKNTFVRLIKGSGVERINISKLKNVEVDRDVHFDETEMIK